MHSQNWIKPKKAPTLEIGLVAVQDTPGDEIEIFVGFKSTFGGVDYWRTISHHFASDIDESKVVAWSQLPIFKMMENQND